jgi:hypothetical protein
MQNYALAFARSSRSISPRRLRSLILLDDVCRDRLLTLIDTSAHTLVLPSWQALSALAVFIQSRRLWSQASLERDSCDDVSSGSADGCRGPRERPGESYFCALVTVASLWFSLAKFAEISLKVFTSVQGSSFQATYQQIRSPDPSDA